jgi:hypothetical protein
MWACLIQDRRAVLIGSPNELQSARHLDLDLGAWRLNGNTNEIPALLVMMISMMRCLRFRVSGTDFRCRLFP